MYDPLSLYIDGQFLHGEGRVEQDVVNPATGEVLGRLPHASSADLEHALAAAARAFESWKHSSPVDRSRILRRVGELTRERAQAIAQGITLDQGKPLAEALGEVTRCADETRSKPDPAMLQAILDFYALAPHQAVMIGDTTYDLEMAQRIGMPAIGVRWGAHNDEALGRFGPRAIVGSVEELRRELGL